MVNWQATVSVFILKYINWKEEKEKRVGWDTLAVKSCALVPRHDNCNQSKFEDLINSASRGENCKVLGWGRRRRFKEWILVQMDNTKWWVQTNKPPPSLEPPSLAAPWHLEPLSSWWTTDQTFELQLSAIHHAQGPSHNFWLSVCKAAETGRQAWSKQMERRDRWKGLNYIKFTKFVLILCNFYGAWYIIRTGQGKHIQVWHCWQ